MPITAVPRRYRRGLRGCGALAGAAALTAVAAVLAPGSPPAQAALSHRPYTTTPDATSPVTDLVGVSADSAADAWAVGYYNNSSGAPQPLSEHWNGTAWKTVKTPPPAGATQFNPALGGGVSADSPTDAWEVGAYSHAGIGWEPLTEHWNGTAWKTVNSLAPSGAANTQLQAVSADSAADAWAAGDYYNSSGVELPLIEHWNGTAWKLEKSPAPTGATNTQLQAVSAVSATDAWAAGYYVIGSVGSVEVPLIEHWNGTAWKMAKIPVLSGAANPFLNGVSAVSAADAWAVGSATNPSSETNEGLILHWNGIVWKQVKSPAPSGAQASQLLGVSAVSAGDAWAAGWYQNSSELPLILHWNGIGWKQAKIPVPSGAQASQLSGVSAVSPTNAWAAGNYTNSSGVSESLIMRWNGTAWKKVTSPNGP